MTTLYFNGKVFAGSLPLKEAFAVEGERFCFCGSSAEGLELAEKGGWETVDLEGVFVCSGFNDSHMHLLDYGVSLDCAPLAEHTGSLEEVIACLRDYLEKNGPGRGGWLQGKGWNQDYFSGEKRMPDRFDLDRVSTDVPIIITRACIHCVAVNSKALELIGIDRNTPDPEGGTIGRDASGEPDGRLFEKAKELAYGAVPLPDKEDIKRYLTKACRALNSYGVTSCQTDDYCIFRELPWQTVNEAYEELEAEGLLTARIYEQANFTDRREFEAFMALGNRTGKGSALFKTGPLKMLGDGSLGAYTARLSVPYVGTEDTYGVLIFTPEQLSDMVDCAVEKDMQVAVHAIGDACLDNVLDAYERAFAKYGKGDRRCGIVHCQISRPEQLERIAALGLRVYMQSIFLDYDIKMLDARVCKELADSSYCWKTLALKGVGVSNGTDCPVEPPDPMRGLQCAVTRRTLDGTGPYLPREAFSVEEALWGYTGEGARASFEEGEKGRIEAGMLADFVILDGDPFTVPPDRIRDIRTKACYLGGRRVY